MIRFIIVCSAATAIAFGSGSAWIYGKSVLGQILMELAWQKSLASETIEKAWPWADTWPVAKLVVEKTGSSLIVLEGVSGEALAFGPGRISETSASATAGTFAIGGHRDSHLAFLEHLNPGDGLLLQTLDGSITRFEVDNHFVADSLSDTLTVSTELHALILITCFPFNALQTGGSKRYVVVAYPAKAESNRYTFAGNADSIGFTASYSEPVEL